MVITEPLPLCLCGEQTVDPSVIFFFYHFVPVKLADMSRLSPHWTSTRGHTNKQSYSYLSSRHYFIAI